LVICVVSYLNFWLFRFSVNFHDARRLRAPQGTGFDRLDRYRVRCKRKEGLVVAGICTAVSWNRPKAREGHPAILQTAGAQTAFADSPGSNSASKGRPMNCPLISEYGNHVTKYGFKVYDAPDKSGTVIRLFT